MKKIIKAAAVLLSCGLCMLSGCSTPSYDGYQAPAASPSQLKPITNGGYRIERSYDNVEPTKEKTIKAVTSSDGMCSIIKKASYYEVTLDYENGSHKTNGAAYAETILKIYPDYPKKIDGYIFEMIEKLIPENDKDKKKKYDLLNTGLYALKDSLDDDYREELEAYAEKISGGVRGIAKDGKLSYEEAIMMNMVPDLLRGTACSAITANGKKTETAHRLAARLLEWDPGSKKQLSEFHCLVHFKNGERSSAGDWSYGSLPVVPRHFTRVHQKRPGGSGRSHPPGLLRKGSLLPVSLRCVATLRRISALGSVSALGCLGCISSLSRRRRCLPVVCALPSGR